MKLPDLITKMLDGWMEKFPHPSEWTPSPMIARDDALRLGEQILAKRPITVNGTEFIADHVIGGFNPSPDKDLYLLVESADQKRSIEMALYKGGDRSEFGYTVGTHSFKKGEDVYKILDADGNIVDLLM